MSVSAMDEQPVVKLQLHSAGDASPLTALLLPHIWTICSVVTPCQRGASPPSVRRWTFTTDCYARAGRSVLADSSPDPRTGCGGSACSRGPHGANFAPWGGSNPNVRAGLEITLGASPTSRARND